MAWGRCLVVLLVEGVHQRVDGDFLTTLELAFLSIIPFVSFLLSVGWLILAGIHSRMGA
jgi:hypothetical protein